MPVSLMLIAFMLGLIVLSLAMGVYGLVKNHNDLLVHSLSWRISLSLLLFIGLLFATKLGWVHLPLLSAIQTTEGTTIGLPQKAQQVNHQ